HPARRHPRRTGRWPSGSRAPRSPRRPPHRPPVLAELAGVGAVAAAASGSSVRYSVLLALACTTASASVGVSSNVMRPLSPAGVRGRRGGLRGGGVGRRGGGGRRPGGDPFPGLGGVGPFVFVEGGVVAGAPGRVWVRAAMPRAEGEGPREGARRPDRRGGGAA